MAKVIKRIVLSNALAALLDQCESYTIGVPAGSTILSVVYEQGSVVAWIEEHDEAALHPPEQRAILFAPPDANFPTFNSGTSRFITTMYLPSRRVMHVYELR